MVMALNILLTFITHLNHKVFYVPVGERERVHSNPRSRLHQRNACESSFPVYAHQAGSAHLQAAAEAPETERRIDLLLNPVQEDEDGHLLPYRHRILLIARLLVAVRSESENSCSNRVTHLKPPASG